MALAVTADATREPLGLTDHVWSMEDVVRLLEQVEAPEPAAQAN